LTGESHSDATGADASVLANDPTFTSCLGNYYMEIPGKKAPVSDSENRLICVPPSSSGDVLEPDDKHKTV
jgi:hypothetical protein